ncbi:MAG: AAA family ATPase [Methylotenera sp.]|nr:AAA family ATPase [Methylotenera sp.]
MYYPHFGLKEPPFKITPNTDFFFSGCNRGAVLDALVYAITNGEGIIKVVGEVGSGKTMLCRMLQTILPEKIESIYLANPSVAPEDVLHAIAFELQLQLPKNADRLKVMQLLQAHLLSRHAEGRQVVIFVEEAQGMPLATLEEIRLLSNLETKQDKLLQIVLFGQPELDINLSESNIRQLRERITHSFHLDPLATKDVGEYLILRLRAAGYHGPHLFSDAAIKKLSSAAKGLARRVNILADKSLLAAFADNVYQVTPKHVKAAIQDSEFGRNSTNYKQYFVWAIVLIGLLAASMVYIWWQYQYNPQANFKPSVNKVENKLIKISPVKNPVAVVAKETTAIENSVAIANDVNATTTNDTSVLPANSTANVLPATLPAPKVGDAVVASPTNTQTSIATVQPVAPIVKPDALVVKKIIDTKQALVDKRMELTRSWLFSEQPNTITLQIKSLPTEAKSNSDKFNDKHLKVELDKISQQLEVDNIYIYRKKQNGEVYAVILYGNFPERGDALAALKNLPEPIKNNRPYLRTLAGINRDIEQAQ